MKPSEYIDRNCFLAASTPGVEDIDRRATRSGSATCCGATTSPIPRAPSRTPARWIRQRFKDVPPTTTPPHPRPQRGRALRHRRRGPGAAGRAHRAAWSSEVHGGRPAGGARGMTVDPRRPTSRSSWAPTATRTDAADRPGPCRSGLPDAPRSTHAVRPGPAGARHASPRAAASPSPIPNGWFIVARSDELAPGDVRPLYVLRAGPGAVPTEAGEPRVLDAYCPHLGAHLAVGRPGRGRLHPLPVPRVEASTASPATCVEIPYGEAPASRPGRRPQLPGPRAQPHDLGLAPRRGRAALLRRAARCPSSPTRTGRRSWSATSRSRHRPGDGGEQRGLRALQVRARHRRHPRGRVRHRRHVQARGRRTAPSSGRASGSVSACCG